MVLVKKDYESLKEIFMTKEEFNFALGEVNLNFDKLLVGQDKIISELEKAREDRIFAIAKDREQDAKLNNLDSRVSKLETSRV